MEATAFAMGLRKHRLEATEAQLGLKPERLMADTGDPHLAAATEHARRMRCMSVLGANDLLLSGAAAERSQP